MHIIFSYELFMNVNLKTVGTSHSIWVIRLKKKKRSWLKKSAQGKGATDITSRELLCTFSQYRHRERDKKQNKNVNAKSIEMQVSVFLLTSSRVDGCCGAPPKQMYCPFVW